MSTSGYNTLSASGKQSTATPMTHLFKGLENLWNTRAQADIIVNIQGKKISCHKVVLMAASSYFEAMFNSGMQEAISGEINFKDMNANTFELILEYIYTGKDDIVTIENGFALFEAASLLQIEQLFKKCEDVLSQNIALDNCLDTWRFASVHNSDQLRFGAFEVILSQFEEFVKKDGFMTLKFNELYKIIQHDRLNVPTEEFLLKVVLEWGNDCADNKAKLGKLCSNLRLCQLSGEHLISLKKYFSTTIDSELARKTIDKALQYKLIPARRQATNSIIVGY